MGIFDRIAGQLGELIAPDEVRERVARAERRLDEGDLDGALRELSWALMRAPDHARAAYLLGIVLARKGELDGAVQALEQALQLRPEHAEAQVALGEVLRRVGRYDEALERFRRGIDQGVSDPVLLAEAYRGRGVVHLLAGRTDKAVRELRKAAAALPADGESNWLLGLALADKGDLDGARLCLEKAAAALARPDSATPTAGSPASPPVGAVGGALDEDSTLAHASPTPAEPRSSAPMEPPALSAVPPDRDLVAVLAALGEVYRRLGRRHDAGVRLENALATRSEAAAAHLVRSRLLLDEGEAEPALREAERALASAEAGGADAAFDPLATRLLFGAAELRAAVRLQLARAAARAGDPETALAAFDDALRLAPDDQARAALVDEAMHLALAAGHDARAASFAARLQALAATPTADRLAALALGRIADSHPEDAELLLSEARALGGGLETQLAEARLHIAKGRRTAAAATLRLCAEHAPSDPRPKQRLAEVYRAEHEPAHPDLYALLVAAHRQLQKAPETSDLAPEAARVVEILDRPLLLTVMGEFNAGKSTFVNALVGEQVAPMGITPTTATINVLKYGAERGGRVVYRDDTIRHVAWSDVGPLLRGLDDAEASRIRFVEVLYPHETLQRVNIVDTPGLNSIRPEHEATAREFIAQADAILWLFSCRQPGTASEREALGRVRDEGRKVLGVVNMIDLVEDDADQKEEVLGHLREHFGALVEAFVPFSAREALLGRESGDAARLARSNRDQLERALAEHFFDRAKTIQREVAGRRLGGLLDEARLRTEGLLGPAEAQRVREAESTARTRREAFLGPRLDEERQRCVDRLGDLYAQAAREVLEFVRPRRWPFGANEAQRADRDFLVGLIEQQLLGLADDSSRRLQVALSDEIAALRALSASEAEALVELERQRLDAQVYGRYRAFTRGYLRGGRVDDFFTRVLPRLDLGESAIGRALLRDMPALAVLEEELIIPLRGWAACFFEDLLARLERLRRAEELRRFEIEERLLSPLISMRAALEALGLATPHCGPESPTQQPPHAAA